jgi:GTP-binding protein
MTNTRIAPKINFSLEECMEYIQADEYVEITPQSLRLRKIHLNGTIVRGLKTQ